MGYQRNGEEPTSGLHLSNFHSDHVVGAPTGSSGAVAQQSGGGPPRQTTPATPSQPSTPDCDRHLENAPPTSAKPLQRRTLHKQCDSTRNHQIHRTNARQRPNWRRQTRPTPPCPQQRTHTSTSSQTLTPPNLCSERRSDSTPQIPHSDGNNESHHKSVEGTHCLRV